MLPKEVSVVAGENHYSVLSEIQLIERLEQPTEILVHALDMAQIVQLMLILDKPVLGRLNSRGAFVIDCLLLDIRYRPTRLTLLELA